MVGRGRLLQLSAGHGGAGEHEAFHHVPQGGIEGHGGIEIFQLAVAARAGQDKGFRINHKPFRRCPSGQEQVGFEVNGARLADAAILKGECPCEGDLVACDGLRPGVAFEAD